MNIAFYLNGNIQPQWVVSLIAEFLNKNGADNHYLILNEVSLKKTTALSILHRLYSYIDDGFFVFNALKKVNNSVISGQLEVIRVNLENNDFNHLTVESRSKIDSKKLDYIVSLSDRPIEYCDGLVKKGLLQFVNENQTSLKSYLRRCVLQNEKLAKIMLTYSNGHQTFILQDIVTKTDRYSANRTLVKIVGRKGEVLKKALKKLNESLFEVTEEQKRILPHQASSFFNLLKIVGRFVIDKLQDICYETHWEIAIIPKLSFSKISALNQQAVALKNPNNSFWADPFLWEKNGDLFVFFEEYPYPTRKGILACAKVDFEGNVLQYWKILEKEYHLSFPFLMKENDELFMIPETCNNQSIDLYRCVTFPNQWQYQCSLLKNIKGADTILQKIDNKYWLFTCVSNSEELEVYEDLYIFYAEDIGEHWQPHAQNPIKTDVCSARPAGALIEYDNVYYRPVQNGKGGYGYAVEFYQIIKLTESVYEEKKVDVGLYPTLKEQQGLHTFNESNTAQVIDIKLYKSKFKFGLS